MTSQQARIQSQASVPRSSGVGGPITHPHPLPPACAMFSLDRLGEDLCRRDATGSARDVRDRQASSSSPPTLSDRLTFDLQDTLKNLAPTSVSNLFFSPKNFYALQHGIRYRVWVETQGKYVISPQSETELSAIMRGVYLEFSQNSEFRVLDQVVALNARIINYAVPHIVSELAMRAHYLRDISHQPDPLETGAATSIKGRNQLEMKPFF